MDILNYNNIIIGYNNNMIMMKSNDDIIKSNIECQKYNDKVMDELCSLVVECIKNNGKCIILYLPTGILLFSLNNIKILLYIWRSIK